MRHPDAMRERALQLLHDGASYCEVGRTLGVHRWTVSRWHPGYGWTSGEGGAYGGMVKAMNEKMRRLK